MDEDEEEDEEEDRTESDDKPQKKKKSKEKSVFITNVFFTSVCGWSWWIYMFREESTMIGNI